MKTRTPLVRIHRLLNVALTLSFTGTALAGTTNSFRTNTAMTTAGNYSTGSLPTNTTDVLITTTTSNNLTVSSASITAESLSVSNGTGYTIGNATSTANSRSLILGNSVGFTNAYSLVANDLIFLANSSALTIFGPNRSTGSGLLGLILNSSGNFSIASGSFMTSTAIISGASSINKTGGGTLTLSAVNTFGGAGAKFTLTAGTLNIDNSTALGNSTNTFVIDGGTIDNSTAAAITTANYAQTWGGDFAFTGTRNLNLGTGAVSMSASRQVTANANALTVGGVISGAGFGLTKAGAGTLILGGANTYSGTTLVNAGTLELSNVNALQNSLLDTGTSGAQVVTFTVGGNNTYNIAGLQGADALAIGGNTLSVGSGGGDTTYSGAISGTGGLTKTGIGRLSLSGSSSYNGATTVSAGDLNLSGGSIASSAVTVASGASLSGYGSVGTIGGAGAINPGNSPGILTTPQVNPSAGTTFNFEMTGTAPIYSNAASSVNDLIRITGGTPFSPDLAGNGINIYFSGAALFTGSTAVQYQGGFFTDQSASFASSISGATYTYYFANASGTNSYNGANYYNKAQYESLILGTNMLITVSTVAQTANFGGGNIDGQVMQVQVIPEPSTYALLGLSAAAFGAYRWRRRRRG